MRASKLVTSMIVIGLLGLCGSLAQQSSKITLTLVDADSGREIPGLIRIIDETGESVAAPGLLSRGLGLNANLPISQWQVVPTTSTFDLPAGSYSIEAISGLETEQARLQLDLTGRQRVIATIPIKRFYNAAEQGLASANTHLHLRKLDREMSDRYLVEIPRSDRLDILFVSYLERAGEDVDYISNRYTTTDLVRLSKQAGIYLGNGEEHRHNFTGFGEGYGHVMLLNIQKLIQPVSIGPGIMKMGSDGLPLQRGIDTARRNGATIIWCHNNWGRESFPNWVNGRVDAQNIFDGGSHGSYKNSFYRYLNAGLRVPFSTGTDWFMYDFSRVYVEMQEEATPANWLKALSAGRSYITNGPLLEFSVEGQTSGDTIAMNGSGTVSVVARGLGRVDFQKLELIRNGQVIQSAGTQSVDGHFEANFELEIPIDEPSWLALRTPPPSVNGDPELQTKTPLNEFGKELFAHTSPVFIEVDGNGVFDKAVAREFLAEMEASQELIPENGTFESEEELARVLDVYRDGITSLKARLAE